MVSEEKIFEKVYRRRMPIDGNSSYRWAKNCSVCRSWQAEHVCSLNLTSISYIFWNNGRKVLKFWKFDEKRAITPKWVIGFIKNCRVGRSWHAAHCCNLNLTFISYSFWNKGRKELKFWKCDEKRTITPKWELGFIQKLQGR